jgi:hypothetical protein
MFTSVLFFSLGQISSCQEEYNFSFERVSYNPDRGKNKYCTRAMPAHYVGNCDCVFSDGFSQISFMPSTMVR